MTLSLFSRNAFQERLFRMAAQCLHTLVPLGLWSNVSVPPHFLYEEEHAKLKMKDIV